MVGTEGNLNMMTMLGYGTGHVLNDMVNAMWFTYTLIFFHSVIRLSNSNAGLVLLVGQITDGLSSLSIGLLMDQDQNLRIYSCYGKRKVLLIT